MATAKEEKDEQAFFSGKVKEQNQQGRKEQTMANEPRKSATELQAEKEGRATPKEKRMTHREAIEELEELIGTRVPLFEADSLKKQLAMVGDPDTELPLEMEAAVENLKKRAEEKPDKSKTPAKK